MPYLAGSFAQGSMSVDRLDHADRQSLSDLHDKEAATRKSVKEFYGWYYFKARQARDVEWIVDPDPTPENPWHAEISNAQGDKSALYEACQEVAAEATWASKPLSPQIQEQLDEVLRS